MAATRLFDPEGVDWQGVSPRLATARVTIALVCFGILALGGVATGLATRTAWVFALVAVPVAFAAWITWIIRRQVRALGYAERDDDFLIRRGVMFRSLSVVPYGRMQYVDVSVGPIDRAFGIAKLELHTAAVGLDVSLPGLRPEEAARLRDRLASRGEAQLAGL
jgi:membrane protein YdbS with pleckstrin-like domain